MSITPSYSGGVCAYNENNKIIKCISFNKKVEGNHIGKIVGWNDEGEASDCHSSQEMLLNGDANRKGNSYNINGKNIPLNLMNETFFKRLGWDFNNIWAWDNIENRPILNIDLNEKKKLQKILHY